jgi:putative PIN family toxin of toxin-antitoxin system
MITVVLDTNVLVSSLLSATSSPAKILDRILENEIQVIYDDRILGEYEEVLSRPELHIAPPRMTAVIAALELNGRYVESEPLSAEGYTDPDDMMFVEAFRASHADALVTGNLRHYKPLLEQNAMVLTPAQFLEKFFPG